MSDHYGAYAQAILDHLSAELPFITDWSGTVGVGIASNNVEYFDEPALALMLCELPHDQYRVFSGVSPLPSSAGSRFKAHTALVHADAGTPDVAELIMRAGPRGGRRDGPGQQWHRYMFYRRKFRQRMMGLVDETELAVAQFAAACFIERLDIASADHDRAAGSSVQPAEQMQQCAFARS